MQATTIKLHRETKKRLDAYREYRNESYDEVIQKMIYIAEHVEKEPRLSKKALKQIEEARYRMDILGEVVTEEEVDKMLGLSDTKGERRSGSTSNRLR